MVSALFILKRMGIAFLVVASPIAAAKASQLVDASEETVIVEYTSVFKDYTQWEWEDVGDWPRVNSVVEEIGGWEVYAREPEESETEN